MSGRQYEVFMAPSAHRRFKWIAGEFLPDPKEDRWTEIEQEDESFQLLSMLRPPTGTYSFHVSLFTFHALSWVENEKAWVEN